MFAKIKNFILYPLTRYKEKQKLKKRLEELRKRDPFIYE
jgi:hypothetical protein